MVPKISILVTYFLLTQASLNTVQIFSTEIRFAGDSEVPSIWANFYSKIAVDFSKINFFNVGEYGVGIVCSLRATNRLWQISCANCVSAAHNESTLPYAFFAVLVPRITYTNTIIVGDENQALLVIERFKLTFSFAIMLAPIENDSKTRYDDNILNFMTKKIEKNMHKIL